MHLLSPAYLDEYAAKVDFEIYPAYRDFKKRHTGQTSEDFSYYLVASSVFSSRIEGVSLDLNSFMRNRDSKRSRIRKEVQEIESLIRAYEFATTHSLSLPNVLKAHALLAVGLKDVPARMRGKTRKKNMAVWDSGSGRPVYVATEWEEVKDEMKKLFTDVSLLIERRLTYEETFYYASMLHLWVAMIHPFDDGNGRTARLVEKWFLSSKLGKEAWSLRSEKYYWDDRPAYYHKIALGLNYYVLKWERCVPFLLMLPDAILES